MNATGRKLLMAAALAAGPLLAMSAAHADEISLGGSAATMSFTSTGNGIISFNAASGFSGTGNFESPTGTTVSSGPYTLTALSGTAGPEVSGTFPITAGGTDTLTYSDSAGNSLTGTATFAGIKDGSSTPVFDAGATVLITASSGSSTFTSDFKVGSTPEIDFTLGLGSTNPTLTTIATKGGTTSGFFSSGEVMPGPAAVPEPASLTLFGTALLGLGLFLGLRRSKRV